MFSIFHDIRFAIRSFTRSPSLAVLTVLTLGLGIGATTAIFSAVNEVMLRPLPFSDPDRLVMLWEANAPRGWDDVHAAPANVLDWRERVTAFEDVAFVNEFQSDVSLSGGTESVQVVASQVSGNAFDVLGVQPHIGRTFRFEETWAGSNPVLVLAFDAWRRYFGADSTVVGKTVRLDGIPFEVIGVMGPRFAYTVNDAEVWTTFRYTDGRRSSIWFRQAHVVRPIARLADGVSLDEARVELTAVAQQLEREFPTTNTDMKAGLTPLHRFLVGDRRASLLLLLGAVGVLQLIACANVANLLLARALGRRQEMAVRSALGAGRTRIIRQVLTESLVIASLGAAVGLAVGVYGLDGIAALRPPTLPDLAFTMDWRMLGFTALIVVASAVLFGILPALRSARTDVTDQLADNSRTGTVGRQSLLAANGLVSIEIGLAVMLVVGAGLMMRSLREMRGVDAGIDPSNVLTFEVRPPSGTYPNDADKVQLVDALLSRIEALPGVLSAGAGRRLPYTGFAWSSDFSIEGWGPDEYGIEVRHREVTPGYFRTLGVPVVDGSPFPRQLGPDERVPVVVNQAFVDRYFPNASPVGHRIAFDRSPDSTSYWYPIVGVVGSEGMDIVSGPQPEIISHLAGDTPNVMRFVVKTDVAPLSVVPAVRNELAQLDAEIPMVRVRTMEEVAGDALAADRFLMVLLGVFAAAALAMAAIGVYGVAAQAVRSRTREIGIRMALGASARDITRTLIVRGLTFVGIGIALGIVGSALASGALRNLLFGVEPNDPLTLIGVAVVLAVVAISATVVPVWRAAQLDPARVLNLD